MKQAPAIVVLLMTASATGAQRILPDLAESVEGAALEPDTTMVTTEIDGAPVESTVEALVNAIDGVYRGPGDEPYCRLAERERSRGQAPHRALAAGGQQPAGDRPRLREALGDSGRWRMPDGWRQLFRPERRSADRRVGRQPPGTTRIGWLTGTRVA